MPEELARRESRLAKIEEAKKALEERAQMKAQRKKRDKRDSHDKDGGTGSGQEKRGRPPKVKDPSEAVPEDKRPVQLHRPGVSHHAHEERIRLGLQCAGSSRRASPNHCSN